MSPETERIIFIVFYNVIVMAILAGVPVLVMWLTGRFVQRWAAIGIGVLAVGLAGRLIVGDYYGVEFCGTIIGPVLSDAPRSTIDYIFVWLTGPVTVALLLVAISFQYLQLSRGKDSAR